MHDGNSDNSLQILAVERSALPGYADGRALFVRDGASSVVERVRGRLTRWCWPLSSLSARASNSASSILHSSRRQSAINSARSWCRSGISPVRRSMAAWG